MFCGQSLAACYQTYKSIHIRLISILGFISIIVSINDFSSFGEISTNTRRPDLMANLFKELAGDASILFDLEIFEILEILIFE